MKHIHCSPLPQTWWVQPLVLLVRCERFPQYLWELEVWLRWWGSVLLRQQRRDLSWLGLGLGGGGLWWREFLLLWRRLGGGVWQVWLLRTSAEDGAPLEQTSSHHHS